MTSPIHILSRGVIIDQDHLLLAYNPERSIPYTYLPGGHVEEGESAEAGLLRELREETALHFETDRYLGCLEHIFTPHRTNACHRHEYNFVFTVKCTDLKYGMLPDIQEDHVRFIWQPLSKLEDANLLPGSLVHLLPMWLKGDHTQSFMSQVI